MNKELLQLDEIIRKSPFKKKALADMLGIASQTFSNKLKGRQDFNVSEAITLAKALDIPLENIEVIFLPCDVERM